jgi:hypothetical protein
MKTPAERAAERWVIEEADGRWAGKEQRKLTAIIEEEYVPVLAAARALKEILQLHKSPPHLWNQRDEAIKQAEGAGI